MKKKKKHLLLLLFPISIASRKSKAIQTAKQVQYLCVTLTHIVNGYYNGYCWLRFIFSSLETQNIISLKFLHFSLVGCAKVIIKHLFSKNFCYIMRFCLRNGPNRRKKHKLNSNK